MNFKVENACMEIMIHNMQIQKYFKQSFEFEKNSD